MDVLFVVLLVFFGVGVERVVDQSLVGKSLEGFYFYWNKYGLFFRRCIGCTRWWTLGMLCGLWYFCFGLRLLSMTGCPHCGFFVVGGFSWTWYMVIRRRVFWGLSRRPFSWRLLRYQRGVISWRWDSIIRQSRCGCRPLRGWFGRLARDIILRIIIDLFRKVWIWGCGIYWQRRIVPRLAFYGPGVSVRLGRSFSLICRWIRIWICTYVRRSNFLKKIYSVCVVVIFFIHFGEILGDS